MKPTQAAIARALDLSQAAVSKLKAQGMPVESIEGAHAWRLRNLDPARIKWSRPVTDPAAALRRVHDLAQLAAAALKLGRFEAIEPQLRMALRAVPKLSRGCIVIDLDEPSPVDTSNAPAGYVIPLAVWEALLQPLLAVLDDERRKCIEAGEPDPHRRLTDEEAEEMAPFWMAVAAGELVAMPG